MIPHLLPALHEASMWLGWFAVWLLCAAGLLISAVGISGTWLVLVACAIAAPLSGAAFPGWGTVALFAGLAVAVDVIEWFASHWGVRRRGGSRLAGFAAMAGGLLGLLLGTLIPIPIIGNFIGMVAGSFGLAFAVERHRLKSVGPAARIASGAVLACVVVLMLKVVVSLSMVIWLAWGILGGRSVPGLS